jgi:hypothetical protein
MKINNIHKYWQLPLLMICFSCNSYLDEMPDNRAEVDNEDKVTKLLVEAYPDHGHVLCCEFASDNIDDFGATKNTTRFWEQLYGWIDVTETDNESPQRAWQSYYKSITNANQALLSIEEMGNPSSLDATRGEALVCRAYNHFMLVNLFCQHYSPTYSATDLGIPYMEKVEDELNPKYERGTVAHDYELIEKDLEAGLPLINDAIYTVPKYHFNRNAAYTFASRFYLFCGKWDKAIECANEVLGSSPAELLRDNAALAALPRSPLNNVLQAYTSTSNKCNFLIHTAYSKAGSIFRNVSTGGRFTHGYLVARTETMNCAPWGTYSLTSSTCMYFYLPRTFWYSAASYQKVLAPRIPYYFEYTDPVAGTGYAHCLYVAFKAEEALLNRAEAYVMLGEYDKALEDMNLWTSNSLNKSYAKAWNLTSESIQAWADKYAYYTPETPTPKKHLHCELADIEEGSLKESFIHCLLYMRRYEFLHEGMRWFDIKRYGIEIYRRTLEAQTVVSVTDELPVRDERRAMQIPADVITAGLEPNPRSK